MNGTLTNGALSVVIGVPFVGLVYFAVLMALGIRPEDRLVLAWVRDRLRPTSA